MSSLVSKISSYFAGISIVTKFVFWTVLLLVLTGYVVTRSAGNNQSQQTQDFTYWQDQYRTMAAALATNPADKATALSAKTEIAQVTVQQFPFQMPDGTNQQRVDRCQSCHAGLEDPHMTAETIIKLVTNGHVNLAPSAVESYLLKPENRDLLRVVKVLSAHPGKAGGIIKGALPFAISVGSSPTPADVASSKLLTTEIAQHPFATYGCTTCHYGSGRELQEVKAHGTLNEAWLQPLLPGKYLDAACAQCHTTYSSKVDAANAGKATYLPQMAQISKGQDLFRTNACWGCHKIEGYSKGNVGPELTFEGRIARNEMVEHQLWDPRYKVNNCVMPYFFSKQIITDQGSDQQYYLTNYGYKRPLSELKRANITDPDITQSLADHGYFPDAASEPMVDALVTYILAQTGQNYAESQGQRITRISAYDAAVPPAVPVTVVEGQQLFEQSGCYACHFLGKPTDQSDGRGGGIAPNLSVEGARHSTKWIDAHYVNPEEFVPKSIMPIFPFSNSQRAALTLFDASHIAPGQKAVSPDQDMSSLQFGVKGKPDTNYITADPEVRYMTR